MKIINGPELTSPLLTKLLSKRKTDYSKVTSDVQEIIHNVRQTGDQALIHYTAKLDKVSLATSMLRVSTNDIMDAYKKVPDEYVDALKIAAKNLEQFHKKQVESDWSMNVTDGVLTGQVIKAISSVGVYTPGGRACYPSSVLMCVIPAKVVGVRKVILCSPPNKNGTVDPIILVAANLVDVDEIYSVGGAQAIAAMAFGTETIPKVDKIVGPGNIYVMAAKQELSKDVGIDLPAGPSEILIIADETADAHIIASDLLAQAEHDPQAYALLVTTSKRLALNVDDEIRTQMKTLSRREIIASSIQSNGLIILVKNIADAIELANLIAPEHLEIQTQTPHKIFEKIQNAGAVFLGKFSAVALGDYSSGLNHVLPTGGYSRIYSGLSVNDFIKRINFIEASKEGFSKLKDLTITLARMEGLDGHARSISIRDESRDVPNSKKY